MGKHKQPAKVVSKDTTKKLSQVVKKGKAAAKTSKIKENGIEAIPHKLKKSTTRRQAPKKTKDGQKSKYFSKDAKEGSDDESDGSEEVNMTVSETTVLQNKDVKIKEEKDGGKKVEKDDESDESDDDEWEEVEELAGPSGTGETEAEPEIPSERVEIEIEMADVLHKRIKKENKEKEFEMYLRRVMNRFNKEVQEDTHKVHLLCLLASGLFRNQICCEPNLLAITMSLIPTNFTTVVKKKVNISYLEDLLKWFKETFSLNPALPEENNVTLLSLLERRLGSLSARNHQEMTYLFLLVLRSLQVFCRLVLSLQPLPLKAPTAMAQASSSPPSKVKSEPEAKVNEPKVSPGSKRPQTDSAKKPESGGKRRKKNNEEEDKKKEPQKKQNPKNTRKKGNTSKKLNEEESSDEEEFQIKSEDESDDVDVKKFNKNSKAKAKDKSQARSQLSGNKKHPIKAEDKEEEPDEPDEKPPKLKVSTGSKRPPSASANVKQERGGKKQKKSNEADAQDRKNKAEERRSRRSTASKVSYKDDSSEGDEGLSEDEYKPNFAEDSEVESEEESEAESEAKSSDFKVDLKSRKLKSSSNPKAKAKYWASWVSSVTKLPPKKEDKEEVERKRKQERMKRRAIKGDDEWIEVYLEGAKKWVCVDVVHGVGRPELCTGHATQPITYVVGMDKDSYLKDLSRRYDPTWLTVSRKRRIDPEWWEETLKFYDGPDSERKKQEDKELQENLIEKPLPTSVAAYKNHPLYALERHILKYEALYPPTVAILGYCRGEPVYSRDCVHTLHSRDTWLKQARTVQLGEEPYKMVRGASNRSRKLRMMAQLKDDNDLPLFGLWQTEKYKPPAAINGRIPRNDFGNVYLYQPCMLPVGCAHLRLPNLNKVANKLQMDCVAAVTGFDFHKGHSHPITDGYIVCEENAEILRAAWEEEQEIQRKKEQEKREKRALGNWKLLVKSLLIKERLKQRYGQQGKAKDTGIAQADNAGTEVLSSEEEDEDESKTAPPSLAVSWPQNRQEEPEKGKPKKALSKREKRGAQKHLFPFEKST
ncbi:DNA repair protein complementing XP-C cells [Trichomycterus rosablanca]|uniref:DNA repair protein complementing XP-C cells n=1 Tax=Trichomycterus rosablanca TaxID=2290929 RepID=UPI002F35AF38